MSLRIGKESNAAFGQNLMMSVLFIAMLLKRKNLSGQSIYIALFKMLGTVLPSILFFLRFPGSVLLNFLYVAIFGFDAIYLGMLYVKHRELGITPLDPVLKRTSPHITLKL